MTIEEDLAICYANLKGPREKDYLGTARALQRLKSHPEYSTNEKLAGVLPVSGEIVREFLTLLKFPEEVQAHFGPGGLRLEHGRRLWQLTRKRPHLQSQVASAMKGLQAQESRYLIRYVLDHPDVSVAEARRRVIASRALVTAEYHVIALLSEPRYKALEKAAKQRKQSPSSMVTNIVEQWLDGRG